MKIVFMGTPDFAVESLKELLNHYEVSAVITQPDKPKGRHYEMTPPPVKVYAQEKGIPVYQPLSMRDEDAQKLMEELNPDLCVVVAYGKILPKNILDIPKHGYVNVHASLLPKYRGASPIQWSIVCGENVTGVSTMQLDEGMDTGAVYDYSEVVIEDTDTAETLSDKLATEGGKLLVKTVKSIEEGSANPIPQDENNANYAPIISKQDGIIDWNKSAKEIDCLIRGLHFWPVAHTKIDGKLFKIFSAEILDIKANPGEIIKKDTELIIGCKDGALKITESQLEGSKRMQTSDMLRGKKINSDFVGE